MPTRSLCLLVLCASTLALLSLISVQPAQAQGGVRPAEEGQRLTPISVPLAFEPNVGQTAAVAQFVARGAGYNLYLTAEGPILDLHARSTGTAEFVRRLIRKQEAPDSGRSATLALRWTGAARNALLAGTEPLPGKANYFIGDDPSRWHTGIPTFAAVRQQAIYEGIDLIYYGNGRQLEYDLVVAPGADPRQVQLSFEGADSLAVNENGDVLLQTAIGEVRQHSPRVYQEVDGRRVPIRSGYVQTGAHTVAFRTESYDRRRTLVIDPVLSWSSLLGGSGGEDASGIAVDSTGAIFVAGESTSTDFSTSPGAPQRTFGGRRDIFITKINQSGTAVVFSTYLGGSGSDYFGGLAVDPSGNAFIGGYTASTDFPTTSAAFQRSTTDTCCADGFITKLSATGSSLVYSTYVLGKDNDGVFGLAVDAAGNAYATGITMSSDFPTTLGVVQTVLGGGFDTFVLKLNPAGSALAYSTFLGGSKDDVAHGIDVDAAGNVVVCGSTESTGTKPFPTTTGALQSTLRGTRDGFLAKLNTSASQLVFSTLFGGSDVDVIGTTRFLPTGDIAVAGVTSSPDFPVSSAAQQRARGGDQDAFVATFNPSASALVFSTYLGGKAKDYGGYLTVDNSGNIYVAGGTESTDFPTVNPVQSALKAGEDAYATMFDSHGTLRFSTFIGGNGGDEVHGIAVGPNNAFYLVGITDSVDFPTTTGVVQTASRGSSDGFVLKLDLSSLSAQPQVLSIISGNNQSGAPGAALADPLVVEVRSGGSPVSGVAITFSGSNASPNPASAQTDSTGRASTKVALGGNFGAAAVTASSPGLTPVTFAAQVVATAPRVSVASGASYAADVLAPNTIGSIFGNGFVPGLLQAPGTLLPLTLGGISVTINDSSKTDRKAPLFFVSPQQINFLVPSDTALGPATIAVSAPDGRTHEGTLRIDPVAPGLFAADANGQGVASAVATLVKQDGTRTDTVVYRLDDSQKHNVAVPIDIGDASDQAFLTLYGTGFRSRSTLSSVDVKVAGETCEVLYAGAQSEYPGLDQLNIRIPRTLLGAGDVEIQATIDSKVANVLTMSVSGVAPPPVIAAVSPQAVTAGSATTLIFTGQYLARGTLDVDPASGVTVTSVKAFPAHMTADVRVAIGAATGSQAVSVVTPSGRSNPVTLSVQPAPSPQITTLNPNSGSVGQTIGSFTLSGTNLTGTTTVEFSPSAGITVNNIQATATTVTAQVAIAANAAPGARGVTVTSVTGKSNSLTFTVQVPLAQITAITPTSGVAGQSAADVTITGSNLSAVGSVEFSPATGITVSNIRATATSVTVQVAIAADAAAGTRTVSVVSPGGRSNLLSFDVRAGVFSISNLRAGPSSVSSTGLSIPLTMDFIDPSGTATSGSVKVNFNVNNGNVVGFMTLQPQGVTPGQTSGTIKFTLSFSGLRVAAGLTLPIEIWLSDSHGQDTNHLTGTFQTQ